MLADSRSDIGRLIDAAIDAAPACIRDRVLLPSVDWSGVDATKVEFMLERLAAEGTRLPGWLAKALLLGGHVLPPEQRDRLEPPLRSLNALNQLARPSGSAAEGSAESLATYLAAVEDLDPEVLSGAVRRLIKLEGGARPAARLALAHWLRAPQALASVQDEADALIGELPAVRIRLAGFSTTHMLAGNLAPAFAGAGFRAEVMEADYGQVLAELMQPGEDRRDVLMVLLDLESLHAPEWRDVEAQDRLVEKLDTLVAALTSYAERGLGPVLVNTVPIAAVPTAGLMDIHHPGGLAQAVQLINVKLAEAARAHPQLLVVDANRALASLPPQRWTDPKLWYYGRLPFSPDATRHLAGAFAGAFRALRKGTAKVLALDLDNTLWGGIFGEDGVAKLLCDDEFPGNAFKAFQRECLRLKSQGFLLALLSKNNADAVTAFGTHPGMLLKEDDFVATRINWDPKPNNIRSLAEELNLGLDSFVFIDDSPHEREAMRRMCPELTVPELPDDPAARPQWLRSLAVTWPIRLTEEDSRRSDMYQADKRRTLLRDKAVSFDDYLRDLDQSLVVGLGGPATIGRIAQMHLRTNQFNLTTERYDEAAIAGMLDGGERFAVLHGRALDKFGDHGLVICATACIEGETAVVKSFLMSCRVIGRGVETAFLGEMLKLLEERGVRQIEAAYIPTKKNGQVRDFYKNAGFARLRPDGEGEIWGWSRETAALPASEFIAVRWES